MENTLENKAKFFSQYINQKIFNDGNGEYLYPLKGRFLESLRHQEHLILKPLSSITDEDAAFIHYGHTAKDVKNYYGGDWKRAEQKQEIKDIDYLRSKGYALPYMGLSVEKQIEYGWIKLV